MYIKLLSVVYCDVCCTDVVVLLQWENHSKSLRLEEQTLDKIRQRIEEKVMANDGTWIDWQYLLEAATLLKKVIKQNKSITTYLRASLMGCISLQCRYTLQYTYPYAYYLGKGARKDWFESQQAQLEAEVENLSWKLERAEKTDRGVSCLKP